MPDWNPNWEDVRWSHPAADAARNSLQRAADLVERTNGERGRAAVTAVGFWQVRTALRLISSLCCSATAPVISPLHCVMPLLRLGGRRWQPKRSKTAVNASAALARRA